MRSSLIKLDLTFYHNCLNLSTPLDRGLEVHVRQLPVMPSHSPDKYFRLLYTAAFVTAMTHGDDDSVLDAGCAEGYLSDYIPNPIIGIDLSSKPARGPSIHAALPDLPFRSKHFSVAVSIDVLEHIPAEARSNAVDELTRCARTGIVLSFPIDTPLNRLRESALNRIETLLRGRPDPFLEEHLKFGLVDPEPILRQLKSDFKYVRFYPCFHSDLWFLISLVEASLSILPTPQVIIDAIRILYNTLSSSDICRDPTYRLIVAASDLPLPETVPAARVPSPDLDLDAIIRGFRDAFAQQSDLTQYASHLEQQLTDRSAEIDVLKTEAARVTDALTASRNEIESITQSHDDIRKAYAGLEESYRDLTTHHHLLAEELTVRNAYASDLQTDLDAKGGHIDALTEQCKNLSNEIARKNSEMNRLQDYIRDHQIEIQRKLRHIELVTGECRRLEGRIAHLEKLRQDFIRQIVRLRHQRAEADRTITRLQKDQLEALPPFSPPTTAESPES